MPRYNPTRTARVNELRKTASNIKSQITTMDSEYTSLEVDSNPTASTRKTRLIEYHIHCEMCHTDNATATRYPGQPPRICDNCSSQYKNPKSARNALYDMQHPEEAKQRKQRSAAKKKNV